METVSLFWLARHELPLLSTRAAREKGAEFIQSHLIDVPKITPAPFILIVFHFADDGFPNGCNGSAAAVQ